MFVELRGTAPEIGRRTTRFHDRSRLADPPALGIVDLDHEPVVQQLWVLERRGATPELLGEHVAVLVEDLAPFVERLAAGRLEHLGPQQLPFVRVLAEHRQPLPLLVGEHPVEAERPHHCGVQVRRDGRELEPAAVLGETHHQQERERARRPTRSVVRIGLVEGVRPAVGDHVLEPGPGIERGERLHQVGLDPLAGSTEVAFDERGENAMQRDLACGE